MNSLPPLPAPNPVNQLKGKRNRAEGKAFEDRLDEAFAYYAKTGYALIDKTPEPFKIIRRLEDTRFIGCFQKKRSPSRSSAVWKTPVSSGASRKRRSPITRAPSRAGAP